MKEHPILFKGEMVRAILDTRKTQTRRVIKPQPKVVHAIYSDASIETNCIFRRGDQRIHCPYGQVGDRLWVRETWRVGAWDENGGRICVDYKADNYARQEWLTVPDNEMFQRLWIQTSEDAEKAGVKYDSDGKYHWKPDDSPARWRSPIHMPRWACRLTLKVTSVRVERLQDISEADARAEGVQAGCGNTVEDCARDNCRCDVECPVKLTYREGLHELLDSINAKRGFSWDSNPWVWAITFIVN